VLYGSNAFYGGLLLSLNKTIIHGLMVGSSVILRIGRLDGGCFADSGESVVLEQRWWQRLAGWHSYF
jgi:hypothetical protein